MIPPFAAAYAPRLGRASSAATDATLTIAPPPAARRRGSAALHTRNVPVRCTASILFQSASESSSIGVNCAKPAAFSTQARPTEPSSSEATASARSPSRSMTATRPPSAEKRRAVAAARPEAPPVASRTLPANRWAAVVGVLVALVVLERDAEPHSEVRDLAVLDRDVEAGRLGDAQVTDRLAGRLHGVPRRGLPRLRADPDHLGHPVDALAHRLAPFAGRLARV